MTTTDAEANLASRLWRRDVSLWNPAGDAEAESIRNGLGWLDLDWMQARAGELQSWAAAVSGSGDYDRVIHLGMGGSSLAAAVFASLFSPARGASAGLPLTVIDTTHPADIACLAGRDLRRCLFIVASKSGDTVETVALYDFFRGELAAQGLDPRRHFVIITDRDSPLREGDAARVFINPSDIGGRYSALSYFGLAPAALLGVDVGRLLARAAAFCAAAKSDDPGDNPALALGMLLGKSALAGRDKLILRLPAGLRAFGGWIEQLIAESCGKDGKGLIPLLADGADADGDCGDDCVRVCIGVGGDCDARLPWRAGDREQIGAAFFRWEFATAIAAHYLRVNPFNQPDVARAKARAAAFVHGGGGNGGKRGALSRRRIAGAQYDLLYPAAESAANARQTLAAFARALSPQTYLALLAFLPEDDATAAALNALRRRLAARGLAVTCGFGPRYLHSTGQLHKGGPAGGRFIQLVAGDSVGAAAFDLAVPGRDYTFGQLHRAQADGDFAALVDAGRPVMRVALKADKLGAPAAALAVFTADFAAALPAADSVT